AWRASGSPRKARRDIVFRTSQCPIRLSKQWTMGHLLRTPLLARLGRPFALADLSANVSETVHGQHLLAKRRCHGIRLARFTASDPSSVRSDILRSRWF